MSYGSCFVFVLKLVVLYVDFKLDESYTPSKISVRAGDGFHNLKVIISLILDENFPSTIKELKCTFVHRQQSMIYMIGGFKTAN